MTARHMEVTRLRLDKDPLPYLLISHRVWRDNLAHRSERSSAMVDGHMGQDKVLADPSWQGMTPFTTASFTHVCGYKTTLFQ
jgi:hypothetical protein